MSIYDKFQTVTTEELESQNAQAQKQIEESYNKTDRVPFLDIVAGINIRKMYPAHPGTKNYIICKAVHWIPVVCWVDPKSKKEVFGTNLTDEKKAKGEVIAEIKRKPVFNSRIHGNIAEGQGIMVKGKECRDLCEAYIHYALEEVKELFPGLSDKNDKTSLENYKKKISPITDWKTGLNVQITWVFYANAVKPEGSKNFGKQEISNFLKEQLNGISINSTTGKPQDRFSHPVEGYPINIIYAPAETDNKKKYTLTLNIDAKYPLTEEELECFIKEPSLEELFKGSFKRSDFEKQVNGLQMFDTNNKFNFFQHSEWQKIVVAFDAKFPKEETEVEKKARETANKTTGTISGANPLNSETVASENYENPLMLMSRENLLKFIEAHKLGITPRPNHKEDRIVDDITDVLVENHKWQDLSKKKIMREIDDLIDDMNISSANVVTGSAVDQSKVQTGDGITSLLNKYNNK